MKWKGGTRKMKGEEAKQGRRGSSRSEDDEGGAIQMYKKQGAQRKRELKTKKKQ